MKTLSERVAERARQKSACIPHANRAIILALRSDIQQAIGDGWSVLAVYKTLYDEGRVTFSYQAFRRYVKRLCRVSQPDGKKPVGQLNKSSAKRGSACTPGFVFDPVPNEEELF